MSTKAKVHIGVMILIGCVFLALGIHYWYDLYQVEQGLRPGQLPFVLMKIYEVAGKWGVGGFYWLFTIYCFYRAGKFIKLAKAEDQYTENEE